MPERLTLSDLLIQGKNKLKRREVFKHKGRPKKKKKKKKIEKKGKKKKKGLLAAYFIAQSQNK